MSESQQETMTKNDTPPEFTAKQIRAMRKCLGMNREEFGKVTDSSGATVKSWELNQRNPGLWPRQKMREMKERLDAQAANRKARKR